MKSWRFIVVRCTIRIREGDPSQMTLAPWEKLCFGMLNLAKRKGWDGTLRQLIRSKI